MNGEGYILIVLYIYPCTVAFVPLYRPDADNPITNPARIVRGIVAAGKTNAPTTPRTIDASGAYLSAMKAIFNVDTRPITTGIVATLPAFIIDISMIILISE